MFLKLKSFNKCTDVKEEVNFIKAHSKVFIARLGLLLLEYSKPAFLNAGTGPVNGTKKLSSGTKFFIMTEPSLPDQMENQLKIKTR